MTTRANAAASLAFDLALPDLRLECGRTVRQHRSHAWWWSRPGDLPQQPLAGIPTVVLVHALTGSAVAGGPGGWWEPLIGPGRTLDPAKYRILCFNNLGSFYGSSAPGMPGFPARKGVTLTSVDQARAILLGLDALRIKRVHLAAGGSLGGMITLALGALAPTRFERLLPIATSAAASPWVIGWNHVAREILRLDPGYPHEVDRGFQLARQLAMLTYRAEGGLAERQGRQPARGGAHRYAIQSYLEHHGRKLHTRFTAHCYELLLDAMDHHDLQRPLPGSRGPALGRIRANTLVIDVDTDQLFTPAQTAGLVGELRRHGTPVRRLTLRSAHGHDAFLLEWDQLARGLKRALTLSSPL